MPVHPTEEEAPSNITEKLAKDPSSNTESTASDHPSHFNEHNPLGTYCPSPPRSLPSAGFIRFVSPKKRPLTI